MDGARFDREVLRRALLAHYPWLEHDDLGPRAVEGGECDRCGHEARLVETCGPGLHRYLGRRCAHRLGEEAWCEGHADTARTALAWLADLPDEADDVARLWWVATGEVQLDPDLMARSPALADVVAGVLDRPDRT
ncbi:MAG: hypothetical protein ACRDUY_07700 [Nitriliruptorales bacterium]